MRREVSPDKTTRIINHGPVVLVTSIMNGRPGITTVAWSMPVEKVPPRIVLEIGEKHYIYECILETGDFVVNIPSCDMMKDIVKCGSCSGRDVDKFEVTGFTREESKEVSSPRIKEALAIMECTLIRDEHIMKEYNMVIGEVKYAEALTEAFDEHWNFEDEKNRTVHHLGDKTFCFPSGQIVDMRTKGTLR